MTDVTHGHPLIQTGPEDEAQGPGTIARDPLPDLNRNYAEDKDVIAYIQANLTQTIFWSRQQRLPLELEWQEIRRLGLLVHDGNRKYIGRSEAYVPTYARARDVLVSQLTRGLFPSDDYMDVTATELSPDGQADEEGARAVKEYLNYELNTSAKIRKNIKPFLKQYVQYGWAVAKTWFHKELKPIHRMKRAKSGGVDPVITAERDLGKSGVRFQARDIFSVYVWPPTVDNPEEATLIFEDIDLPIWYIKEMGKKKGWANLEEAINAPIQTNHNFNRQQQQVENMMEATIPTQNPPPSGDLAPWKTLTEAWTMIPLPDSAYAEGEEPGSPVNVRVLLAGDTILEVKRHPFWHGKSPYLFARMPSEPGQFYPKGTGFIAKYLQYLINDFANQTNDNMTYGLNPMVLANPNMLARNLSPMRPGGVWQVNDVNQAIKFDRPPVEQVQYGQQMVQMWISMLNDDVGAPPILQGTNAGKGARTATSSQILQKNASSPIQDMVEDLEQDIMIPLMEIAHSLGEQYRDQDAAILVDGRPQRISPQQLIKDCQYRWLASSQSANSQQRAQQLLMLLQSLVPLVPLFAQQGKQVDPTIILRKVWTDGLGQRNFDALIKDLPMQMPGMVPGAPGAPPMSPGDMQTQDPNQYVEGGGEDFSQVRDNADAISSFEGGGE